MTTGMNIKVFLVVTMSVLTIDIARGTEETLRAMQRVRIDATGQDLAGRRDDGVVGTRQAGDGIQQDDDIFLVLNKALGLLDHHLGNLHVTGCRLIECR